MHHSDCTPRIPTVTAEEAVKMSWLWSSSQTLKEVSQLFNAITEVPNEFSLTGAYRFMGLITAQMIAAAAPLLMASVRKFIREPTPAHDATMEQA